MERYLFYVESLMLKELPHNSPFKKAPIRRENLSPLAEDSSQLFCATSLCPEAASTNLSETDPLNDYRQRASSDL